MTQCSEPSVDDMLNDPIVRALMASDGVDLGELQRLLQSIAENLRVRRVEDPQKKERRDRPTPGNPQREKENAKAQGDRPPP
jgi:hypothetical protein